MKPKPNDKHKFKSMLMRWSYSGALSIPHAVIHLIETSDFPPESWFDKTSKFKWENAAITIEFREQNKPTVDKLLSELASSL